MFRFSVPVLAAAIAAVPAASMAQTAFSGFTPGNIVLSRSVYTGDSSTVVIGQPLPPVCPTTASCGKAVATDNGSYPSLANSNNVWNNDKADGNFGITSPVFLDQLTPVGSLVSTLPIPANMVTTSFSSKSEMALNLSSDGSAITFMAYSAPPNTIDVSNSNTPGVYDATNPAGGSYFRSVVEVGANGAIQVTRTNSYNGNNGRAAIKAGNVYFMAGNDNNGSTTDAGLVAGAGIQMATPGQSPTTPVQQVGNFSVTAYTNPATGQPYPADKAGKDNNFRGLTIFNNTIYTSKGSGSNGFDTVYQVGTSGTLPTAANAATTSITVLPGFPTVSAKNADNTTLYPFGLFFANANTLYVADEGDGSVADAASSKTAGLQKWILANGTWSMAYVLQKGLNLGTPYSVANYPAALSPATGGLRNIAGKVNGDGTVTIWAVTATVSTNGDVGADPNKLVMITDTLANTTAANEQFTVLRSAAAGEVFRGVCLAPTAGSKPAANVPVISADASPGTLTLAPYGLATATGLNLSPDLGQIEPFEPLPTGLGATNISITDVNGGIWGAPLLYVSPVQITFQIPAGMPSGPAKMTINSAYGSQTASNIQIAAVAPSLYTLNGSGLAAAQAVRVSANGAQTVEPVYQTTLGQSLTALPISMGSATDQVYLSLFATGLEGADPSTVKVTVNGVNAPVTYAGPQGAYPGVDQVNILLPSSLAGKGNVNIQLTAGGVAANPVQVTIQ